MDPTFWLIFLFGCLLILGIATIGAIASRKYHFNFGWLSILSLIIYLGVSITGTQLINATAGITLVGLLSLVEATVGFKLCRKFNANLGAIEEDLENDLMRDGELKPAFVIGAVLFGLFIGWIGTFLA